MKLVGVYQIRNLLTNKIYVGSSRNLKKRQYDHFTALNSGTHDNRHLQNSFNKYGRECFVFEILLLCEQQYLFRAEQTLLDTVWDGGKRCYNIGRNAHVPTRGLPKTQTHKAKISQANTGKKRTIEVRNKLSQIHTNPSREIRHRMSESHKGKRHSEETKAKIAAANRGKKFSAEHKARISASKQKRGCVIIDLMGDDDEVDQTFEMEPNEAERDTDRKRVPFEEPALEIVPVDPT